MSDELQKIIETYQPLYKEKLTEQDALEIKTNMMGFFNLLIEWDKKERKGGK